MAERPDINVNNDINPRVAFIDAPSVTVNIQDLYDTLRKLEEPLVATIHGEYVAAGGKDVIGTGLFVGITATGQNVIVAFEGRKLWAASGTVTTADLTGRNLIDSAATFGTVTPGAWIVNLTDGSVCTALVITGNQIVTDFLGGGFGSDNQFDLGDSYRILNVVQCTIDEGNWVAIDGGGDSINPILPTAGTQVIVARSTSASLVAQSQGDFDAIADAVWDELLSGHVIPGSAGAEMTLTRQALINRLEINFPGQSLILYADDKTTPIKSWPISTELGELVAAITGIQTKRAASVI